MKAGNRKNSQGQQRTCCAHLIKSNYNKSEIMRPQNKSRSRNKNNNRRNNNNNSGGNVMNRVFDSAGPEGRVRGTPTQIIEKYRGLARDAELAGDRVAAENFNQHAEHYSRILMVAQKQAADRQAEHAARQAEQNAQRQKQQADAAAKAEVASEQPVVISGFDASTGEQPDIVATPETSEPAPRRNQRRRKPTTEEEAATPETSSTETPAAG